MPGCFGLMYAYAHANDRGVVVFAMEAIGEHEVVNQSNVEVMESRVL